MCYVFIRSSSEKTELERGVHVLQGPWLPEHLFCKGRNSKHILQLILTGGCSWREVAVMSKDRL